MEKKPELLAPAGNMAKLKVAFAFGADAVYLAGNMYGLRAMAANFTLAAIEEAVIYAHNLDKKVYVTVNILARNQDLSGIAEYLRNLATINIDGLIIADPGIVLLAKEHAPKIEIHLSTQASATNSAAFSFWKEQGVTRVVAAREMTLKELQETGRACDVEIEAFVHGAMCMSYSGRCMLSSFMSKRSANLGACTHPCRWKYQLVEEQRPGEYLPVEEDEHGTYIFNTKDLCMLEHIPALVKAGIKSFKLEGRMKSEHYVATVVNAYRRALDAYFSAPDSYQLPQELLQEVAKVNDRDYCTGFYFGHPNAEDYNYDGYKNTTRQAVYGGLITDVSSKAGFVLVEQRNKFSVGDTLELFTKDQPLITFIAEEILALDGTELSSVPHPKQEVWLKVPVKPHLLAMIRKVELDEK
ncbi:MAG: U32 family peptidase [Clostridia bacterium]